MTPKTLEILTQPTGHIVYPHNNQAELVEAVSLFATSGLRNGEAVILIPSAKLLANFTAWRVAESPANAPDQPNAVLLKHEWSYRLSTHILAEANGIDRFAATRTVET
jgi:hypothetical protein